MAHSATTTSFDLDAIDSKHFEPVARRDYFRFQFFIWGFFLALNLINFAWDGSPSGYRPYIAGMKIYETVLMAVCSHVIWLTARRYGWLKRPSRTRFKGIFAVFVAATTVMVAALPFIIMIHNSARRDGITDYNILVVFIANWVGVTIGLLIWGGLYSAYYYQARNRYLETERARLLAASREAQLMTLKGQINPHFLFNSLNTLRALIQREPANARDAVTRLADMMRYSLTLSDFPVIPLAAELDFVNDYLSLEHLRHEDRLRIQKNVTPETLRENIPPMLLLTLVENAVKHGLNQRSSGIDITCEIWLEPSTDSRQRDLKFMHLRVTNQGLLAPQAADKQEADGTTGTGLRNARERLRIIYGELASLDVSQQAGLVVAEAVVPILPASAPETAKKETKTTACCPIAQS